MSRRTLQSYIGLAVALVIVVGLNFVFQGQDTYNQRVIMSIGIALTLATSLNLINGFTGQFSLGHAGFMSIGAYTSAWVSMNLVPALFGGAVGPNDGMADLALPVCLICGGLTAALAGLLVGVPSLRLRGDYLALVTLGFGEIIRVVVQNSTPLGASLGFDGIPRYTNFIWTFGIAALTVFVVTNMMRSTYGKGFIAVADDEIAAEAMGVNTTRYKVTAFVVGAFFAGVAGSLYAHYNDLIKPDDFGFVKSVEIVVMVILGGMGNTWGVLAAAIVLTYIPEQLRFVDVGGIKFSELRMPLYALILIVLMIVRPQGLFGGLNIKRRRQPAPPAPVKG